jgi:hypothetical protein
VAFLVILISISSAVCVASSRAQTSPKPEARPTEQGQSYESLVAKARSLINEKKPQEAVTQSEAAIQLDDKRWEAYVTAASAYSEQQLYDDAIGMLQMALARAPEDKKALVRSAITESRQHLSAGGTLQPNSERAQPAAGGSPTPTPTQAEIVLWKSIEDSNKEEDFQGYLDRYPNGTYASLATARVNKLEAEAAAEAKSKKIREEAAAKVEAEQAEIRKNTLSVAHLRARMTLSSNPGGFGHLVISEDHLTYQGDDENDTIAKDDVTYIDVAKTGGGNFLRFHLANGAWSFCAIDESDVQNHKFTGCYAPGKIGNLIVDKWGFQSVDNGKRLVPPGVVGAKAP